MTDVYTCSYRLWEPDMGAAVACSLTRPKPPKYTGPHLEAFAGAPQCWPLTPRWEYFRHPDAGTRFEAQLARYGAQFLAAELQTIASDLGAGSLVLLCHEADWGSCHRQRIARYLLEQTGWLIRELGPGRPARPEGTLF
jgi:uncharacterized protein DUF488